MDVIGDTLLTNPTPGSWFNVLPIYPKSGFGYLSSKPGGGLMVAFILKSSGGLSTSWYSGPVGIMGVAVLKGTLMSV